MNYTNNQLAGYAYDPNGNQTSVPVVGQSGAIPASYDIENRLVEVGSGTGIYGQYAYNHLNQRVWRLAKEGSTTAEEIYFYGVDGQRMASYALTVFTPAQDGGVAALYAAASDVPVYFGHRLVERGAYSSTVAGKMVVGYVNQDRLGSVHSDSGPGGGNASFYPWGGEMTPLSSNDRVKFATYTRDGETGMDYAMNRYYSSGAGRFLTPDPYGGSADPDNPGSWNRYAYGNGDPTSGNDPMGLIFGGVGGFGGGGFGGGGMGDRGYKLNCVNGHRKDHTKETRWPLTSNSSTDCWRTTRTPKTS